MKHNKITALLLGILVLISVFPMSAGAAQTDVSLTVDLSSEGIIKPSTDLLLGTNDDWNDKSTEFILQNGISTEPHESFVEFFGKTGVPLSNVRKGGATSSHYDWMSLVGDRSERVKKLYNTNLGIPEIISSVMKVNPNAAFTVVFNINDSPEKCADLVRYLTLNPKDENATNPNTGINWAQVRVDDGVENPVNIVAFELGNEQYGYFNTNYGASEWKTEGLPSWGTIEKRLNSYDLRYLHYKKSLTNAATEYANTCKRCIDAVRAVNPDIKLSVNSNSAAEIDGAYNCVEIWNKIAIEELRDYCGGNCGENCTGNCFGKGINFVTHHDYYFFGTTDAKNSKNNAQNASVEDTANRISRFFGGRDIKILVTEQNMLYNSDITKEMLSSHSYSLRIADFLNSAYNTPEVYSANHHGFMAAEFDSYWGIGRKFKKDDKIHPTSAGLVLALMNEAVGGNVVKTTVNSDGVIADYTDAVISSAHLKDDGKLDLVILNRNETESKSVLVNIKNSDVKYKLESTSVLNGKADANNTTNKPESSKITRTLVNSEEEFTGYTVAPLSMAVLHLVPVNCEPVDDTIGNIKVTRVKNSLRVTDEFYSQNVSYGDKVTAVVLKTGANPQNYAFTDICGFGQTEVGYGIAYFDIPIGVDFENGDHEVIISGEDFSHSTVYKTGLIEDILFENITGEKNSYPEIANNDYKIDITAVLGENVSADAVVAAAVVYGDKPEVESYSDENIHRVAYAAEVESNGDITVYMPQSALSGVYTVIVGVNSNGASSRSMKSFYFTKPDEEIMLLAPPHTPDGKDINSKTDMSQTVYVDLTGLTDDLTTADVFVGYYKNNVLVGAAVDTVSVSNGVEDSAELNFSGVSETPDTVKLFIWEKGSNQPLMRTYAVR